MASHGQEGDALWRQYTDLARVHAKLNTYREIDDEIDEFLGMEGAHEAEADLPADEQVPAVPAPGASSAEVGQGAGDTADIVTLMSPIVLANVAVDWGPDGRTPTMTAAEQTRVQKKLAEAAKSKAAG